jgi:outer membrane lipoprotein SlyB
MLKLKLIAGGLTLAVVLIQPTIALAQTQEQHREAQREQDAHDKRHHNTAKVVGGSAAGGAVVGGLLGGGKGAVIGGAAGAGGGVVADKVRKHNGVKKRERQENPH